MALQYLLSLVCIVFCDSGLYDTFTNDYNISYLWYALFAVIVLYTLLLQMALQYLLSLVCIVCCDSAIYVTFTNVLPYLLSLVCIFCCDSAINVIVTNGFTMHLISGRHCYP